VVECTAVDQERIGRDLVTIVSGLTSTVPLLARVGGGEAAALARGTG
jgi:hypothetical protein